jgi:hypothetical protein
MRNLNVPAEPDDRVNLRLGNLQLLYRIKTSASGWLAVKILVLPFWVFLFAAIPPVMWWRRRRRLRQRGVANGDSFGKAGDS